MRFLNYLPKFIVRFFAFCRLNLWPRLLGQWLWYDLPAIMQELNPKQKDAKKNEKKLEQNDK